MNGAASGLMEALATAQPGTDWDMIPYGGTSWYKYGGGGIAASGSLCGVPNGCCAVLNMVNMTGLAGQVLTYYSNEVFPTSAVSDLYYGGGWTLPTGVPEPILDSAVLARTTALSPLCHISISKWCDAAGVRLTDVGPTGIPHKNDRCGKICADMAAFTAQLINGAASTTSGSPPGDACTDCHNNTATSVLPAQQGNMWCGHCHTTDAVIVSRNHSR